MTNQDLQLQFERHVTVSAQALYEGWTNADLLKQWFTPAPWKTVEAYVEPFPGGAFRTVFQSPEGQRIDNGEGCFLVAIPYQRLTWTNMMAKDFQPKALQDNDMPMVVTLDFIEDDTGCLYRAHVRHVSTEDVKKHEDMGFVEGWGLALQQLVDLIKQGA